MVERLTEVGMFIDTPVYIIKNGKKSEAVDKLAQLENILEKYGVDIYNLDYILDDYSKNKGRDFAICDEMDCLKKDRDTWKRACELACEKIVDILGDCPVSNEDWQQNDDWCEEHCGENEKLLCWDRYFYQQAKKERTNDIN